MLEILGVGLPRTGTASLAKAMGMLGLRTIHHAPGRINLDSLPAHESPILPGPWRFYDDVDAVTDIPAALFYQPLAIAYPGLRYILTIRNTEEWYESITRHCNRIVATEDIAHRRYTERLHAITFGSPYPETYLWKSRYEVWNRMVVDSAPIGSLLTLRLCEGETWKSLCRFLHKPVPDTPFPWENRLRVEEEYATQAPAALS